MYFPARIPSIAGDKAAPERQIKAECVSCRSSPEDAIRNRGLAAVRQVRASRTRHPESKDVEDVPVETSLGQAACIPSWDPVVRRLQDGPDSHTQPAIASRKQQQRQGERRHRPRTHETSRAAPSPLTGTRAGLGRSAGEAAHGGWCQHATSASMLPPPTSRGGKRGEHARARDGPQHGVPGMAAASIPLPPDPRKRLGLLSGRGYVKRGRAADRGGALLSPSLLLEGSVLPDSAAAGRWPDSVRTPTPVSRPAQSRGGKVNRQSGRWLEPTPHPVKRGDRGRRRHVIGGSLRSSRASEQQARPKRGPGSEEAQELGSEPPGSQERDGAAACVQFGARMAPASRDGRPDARRGGSTTSPYPGTPGARQVSRPVAARAPPRRSVRPGRTLACPTPNKRARPETGTPVPRAHRGSRQSLGRPLRARSSRAALLSGGGLLGLFALAVSYPEYSRTSRAWGSDTPHEESRGQTYQGGGERDLRLGVPGAGPRGVAAPRSKPAGKHSERRCVALQTIAASRAGIRRGSPPATKATRAGSQAVHDEFGSRETKASPALAPSRGPDGLSAPPRIRYLDFSRGRAAPAADLHDRRAEHTPTRIGARALAAGSPSSPPQSAASCSAPALAARDEPCAIIRSDSRKRTLPSDRSTTGRDPRRSPPPRAVLPLNVADLSASSQFSRRASEEAVFTEPEQPCLTKQSAPTLLSYR
ncbi:hypothetical protein JHW43_008132 [Diplocarpon mali]|nr:hypothetical protein JHW43_008132 [Diplocarpon mali]